MPSDTPKGANEVGDKAGEDGDEGPSLKMSMIHPNQDVGDNSFFQNQTSFIFGNDQDEMHPMNKEAVEEYLVDDDVGFDTYVVNEENFVASCRQLAD